MVFLFNKFQEAIRTLAKSPRFARDPRHLQFDADVNRLFLYTSYYRLGENSEEKDAEEIIDMASKASVTDQQKQVQENVNYQLKHICKTMDNILRPDTKKDPSQSPSDAHNNSRRSGLSLAVGTGVASANKPVSTPLSSIPGSATFLARRSKPELVSPARATPRETKALSEIDNDAELRYLQPAVEFFRASAVNGRKRAAELVKAALAEALVHYYPLAGRLRDVGEGKLSVDCTGEGVVFVEAEADVSLEELGQPLLPPYPCVEELLCDVNDVRIVVGIPLFFMQVTQLRCGGFVIGLHIVHNIADGYGSIQFLNYIANLPRTGEAAAEVPMPVWNRELLTERIPPQINPAFEAFLERLGSADGDVMMSTPAEAMVGRYFLFAPGDMAALRRHAPAATSFELLTALMWRCRTAALGYDCEPHRRVRLTFSVNARGRWKRHALVPQGFYGNALFYPVAEAAAGDLCGRPLGYALELVRGAKREMTDDNLESMVDFLASLRRRPPFAVDRMYEVADIKWVGQDALDFGWAKRIAGGVPMVGEDVSSKSVSYHMRCKNGKGEDVIAVSMLLPGPAMDRFEKEMAARLHNHSYVKDTAVPVPAIEEINSPATTVY